MRALTNDKNKSGRMNLLRTLALTTMSLALLGACSTAQEASRAQSGVSAGEISDPFEGTNRAIFSFNKAVDHAVIHPVVEGYRTAVPKPVRNGASNFLRNLKAPVRFANQVLQGDVSGAGTELLRTVINTLVGAGGLFDVAGSEGIEYEQEDFGQTLGVWGVGHGPYVVLPFLGPSSLRDYSGYIVDSFADPVRWYLYNTHNEGWYYAKLGADYLDLRDSLMDVLKELESSSIDYYAAVRSTYYQRRNALTQDEIGSATQNPAIPDFDAE